MSHHEQERLNMSDVMGKRALVIGASRGFGRGIAEVLVEAGADVYALSRGDASELVRATGGRIHTITADATEPGVAPRVLREVAPSIVVLNAGATPNVASIKDHSWDSFSANWNTDVKIAFHWVKAILDEPLARGSSVVALSSGAALRGSPLSGGYAGAKATIRFLTEYAAQDAARASLGIRFATLLPSITPAAGVGLPFVEAYAHRQGRSVDEFLGGAPLTPAAVGAAVLRVLRDRALDEHIAFRLDPSGLSPLL
jgi:NAD(P)-dependent dehydrogenase (short-subunit alcohol dehydrogenase family)